MLSPPTMQAMASSAVVNYAPLIIKEILASAHPPPSRLPGLTSHPPPGPATSSRSSGQAEEDPTYEAAAMLFGSIIGAAKLVGVVLGRLSTIVTVELASVT